MFHLTSIFEMSAISYNIENDTKKQLFDSI